MVWKDKERESTRIPEEGLEESKWGKIVVRFKLGNKVKERKYWKKKEGKMCRWYGLEVES